MEQHEYEPRVGLDLHKLRELFDARKVGSTKNTRTNNILLYLFDTSLGAMTPEDPLHSLAEYIPNQNEMPLWIGKNSQRIDLLTHENAKDKFTNRYTLEEDTAQFSESSWLASSMAIRKLFPFTPDTTRADVTLRLLYREANDQRLETLYQASRQNSSDSQPGPATRAG